MKSKVLLLAGVIGAGLCSPFNSVRAQAIYTEGHGDLGIEYEAGETEFEPHWHLHEGAVVNGAPLAVEEEYAPNELIARTSATASAPAGSADWLGVSPGTTIHRLGSETYEPELGFGFEELTESDWLDSTITMTLSGWNPANPGHVALLLGTSPGAPVYASTFNIASSENANSWGVDLGVGHEHLAWNFSAPGYYELTFTWSGTYIGEGAEPGGTSVSGSGTFGVQVVPEPGTWALVGIGFSALLLLRPLRRVSVEQKTN